MLLLVLSFFYCLVLVRTSHIMYVCMAFNVHVLILRQQGPPLLFSKPLPQEISDRFKYVEIQIFQEDSRVVWYNLFSLKLD
jgi:hypothetical protein